MKTRVVIFLRLLTAAILGLPIAAVARIIPPWLTDPSAITKCSDLIVVARPLHTKDTGATTNTIISELTGWGDCFAGKPAFVPVVTTFEAITVLKGKVSTNHFDLVHYRWDPKIQALEESRFSPPTLVCFTNHVSYPTGTLLAEFKHPCYLLYYIRAARSPAWSFPLSTNPS